MGEADRPEGMIAARETCQKQIGALLEQLGVPKGSGIGMSDVPLKWHPKDTEPRPTTVVLSRSLVSFTSEPSLDGVCLYDHYVFFDDILHLAGIDGDVGFDFRAPTEDEEPHLGPHTIVEMVDPDHQPLEEESIQDPSGLDPLRFRLSQIAIHIAPQ